MIFNQGMFLVVSEITWPMDSRTPNLPVMFESSVLLNQYTAPASAHIVYQRTVDFFEFCSQIQIAA
jgi:hypothetical protein